MARRRASSLRSAPARSPRFAAGRRARRPAWPGKPVRIIVPYTPGTGMDILARTLAPHLQAAWGQAHRRRQPARRVGQPRRRRGREVAARRADAADGRQHADHQSGAVREHDLRPAQGPGADRPVRDRLVPARRRRRRRRSSRSTSWSRRRAPGPARSTTPRPASRRRTTWRWSCSSCRPRSRSRTSRSRARPARSTRCSRATCR